VTNEAFARIKIDQLLKDTDWRLTDGISVRYEYPLDDGGRSISAELIVCAHWLVTEPWMELLCQVRSSTLMQLAASRGAVGLVGIALAARRRTAVAPPTESPARRMMVRVFMMPGLEPRRAPPQRASNGFLACTAPHTPVIGELR
jgi:hypothetical protein